VQAQPDAYVESFNGRLRDECINECWFTHLLHVRAVIAIWRREYNGERRRSFGRHAARCLCKGTGNNLATINPEL